MAAAAERPSAGGFVLWLHGSGGSGDESRAQVAPYFSAPGMASSVRLSFPTAATASIPCYGERRSTCLPSIDPASPMMFTSFPRDELMINGPRRTTCSFSLVTPRFKDAICSVASRYGCYARLVSGGKGNPRPLLSLTPLLNSRWCCR